MTASRVSEDVGQLIDNNFELTALLSAGPASRVFTAFDRKLNRTVMIRILNEELANDTDSVTVFRDRMRRESQVDHENILRVLTGDISPESHNGLAIPYFVTEFLGGGSLRSMLNTHQVLDVGQILSIGVGAANGLAAAHQQGVIHYDIRPENLLFGVDAKVRIKDFGLARALSESSLTEPLGLGPSANLYSAPELVSGGQVDGRSDVYSLALVLAECLTGHVPLSGSSTSDTFRIRSSQDLALSNDIGPIKEILEAAVRVDPNQRPDAAQFARDLAELSSTMPKPDRLPLVLTLGEDSATSEMERSAITTTTRPVRTNGDGEVRVDLSAFDGPTAKTPLADQARMSPKVIIPAEPASDIEPQFAVVVDPTEQESILAASRPRSFGPVTPFGVEVEAEPDPVVEPVAKPNKESVLKSDRAKKRWVGPLVATLLLVAVAGGGFTYWWFAVRIPQHAVPRAEGQLIEHATKSLESLNFVVDRSGSERRDGTAPGQVLAQSPAAGTKLNEGETVKLTVSLGPTLRTLPALAGLTRDHAIETLTTTDLAVGTETPQNDEAVPEGTVISAAVAADGTAVDSNGQVPRDTKIDLVVSAGPAPRVIPGGLIGASAEQARAALEEIQLVANILEAYDPKAPKGQIIDSSAKTGESLPRGSKVTLTMSIGPEPIPVPNVIGMTGSSAAAALESQGFIVEGIEGSPTGAVLQTDPTPGEKRQRGTSVRIFTKSK